jgi:ABC-type bacteriocin/lantibiotic exporter with double-glycine peptidase domain
MGAAEIDNGYVMHLCRQTGLDAFIAQQKEGFDTVLDSAGKRLPRGVIQKILLVRALAAKPQLLLIEEPTEGLEGGIKTKVIELLSNLPSATVIAATNDKDFISKCTKVISLTPQTSN